MRGGALAILFLSLVLTARAKIVLWETGDSSGVDDQGGITTKMEISGDVQGEDGIEGSASGDQQIRQKRFFGGEEANGDNSIDFSGDDLDNDAGTKNLGQKSKPKLSDLQDTKQSAIKPQKGEILVDNLMGMEGPVTITAMQPSGPAKSSGSVNDKGQFSLNVMNIPRNFEIIPFQPPINRLKKMKRRCFCPCLYGPGQEFELLGCSGPYTLPCGGCGCVGWPGPGWGGWGVGPGYGCGLGGYGFGVYPGFGGFGGFGGYGAGGCGCGSSPFMVTCCNKGSTEAEPKPEKDVTPFKDQKEGSKAPSASHNLKQKDDPKGVKVVSLKGNEPFQTDKPVQVNKALSGKLPKASNL